MSPQAGQYLTQCHHLRISDRESGFKKILFLDTSPCPVLPAPCAAVAVIRAQQLAKAPVWGRNGGKWNQLPSNRGLRSCECASAGRGELPFPVSACRTQWCWKEQICLY